MADDHNIKIECGLINSANKSYFKISAIKNIHKCKGSLDCPSFKINMGHENTKQFDFKDISVRDKIFNEIVNAMKDKTVSNTNDKKSRFDNLVE
jgi:hypothetical protein